ncbi:hypothetical protein K435DRAFT_668613, partial [Dendrothele bispora CBS 962.96]
MIPSVSLISKKRLRKPLSPTPTPTPTPTPIIIPPPSSPSSSSPQTSPAVETRSQYITSLDQFGLFRIYDQEPTHDPAENFDITTVTDFPLPGADENMPERSPFSGLGSQASSSSNDVAPTMTLSPTMSPTGPFDNIGIFRLMKWFYSVRRKSLDNLTSLVQDVILPADFQQQHFEGFNAKREARRMDDFMNERERAAAEEPLPWNAADGWNQASAKLDLPRARKSRNTGNPIPQMQVEGVWYRNVVDVIKAAFQSEQARNFHLKPFKMMWKPYPDQPELRIHGETFWTERMIKMDRDLPQIPGCHLERVAVAMQLWSDSTHLTSFGTQKMWPIYLYLGNLSKYTRSKSSTFSAHHIAYIP